MRSVEQIDKCNQKANYASKYLDERNYESHQRHGQRISTHRTMRSDPKCDGVKEVFIGKVPRDLFEDELLPKMEKAGRVRKIRLLMDFSGTNRGFAFVEYVTSAEAHQAAKMLNGTHLRPNELLPIGVQISFDNKILSLSNLPTKLNIHELRQELDKIVAEIDEVHLLDCAPGVSSRFAHISFNSHDAATQARRILCPGNVMICGRKVDVEWVKPKKPDGSSPRKSSPSLPSSASSSKSSSRGRAAGSSPPSQPNPDLIRLIESIKEIVFNSDEGSHSGGIIDSSWAYQQQHHHQLKRHHQAPQFQHQSQHQFQQRQYQHQHQQRQYQHQHQQRQHQHQLQRKRYQHQQQKPKLHLHKQQTDDQYHQQQPHQAPNMQQLHQQYHQHQLHQLQLQLQIQPHPHFQHQPHPQQQQQQQQQLPFIPGQRDDQLDLLENAIKMIQKGGIEEL